MATAVTSWLVHHQLADVLPAVEAHVGDLDVPQRGQRDGAAGPPRRGCHPRSASWAVIGEERPHEPLLARRSRPSGRSPPPRHATAPARLSGALPWAVHHAWNCVGVHAAVRSASAAIETTARSGRPGVGGGAVVGPCRMSHPRLSTWGHRTGVGRPPTVGPVLRSCTSTGRGGCDRAAGVSGRDGAARLCSSGRGHRDRGA